MASYTCLFLWLLFLVHQVVGEESQFYISSNRFGCESVNSVHPCPATQLNPDLAIDYETDADMVNITLEEVKMNNASQECISALTTTYCSSLTPHCFTNGSRDYGDARTECWKANRTCPLDTLEDGFCDSLYVGRKAVSPCVKPSRPINGSCPQPKLKMPEDKLDLYIKSSIEYENIGYFANLTTARFANGSRMFSDYCVAKITELYCLPFYCSADEQEIIVEYTMFSCEDIVDECFNTAIDELFEGPLKDATLELHERYIDNCVFYPEFEDSTSTSSETSPDDSTPAYQNVSSTPYGKNVSTTPRQETPSTTPPENKTSTTPQQNIPTTTLLENTTSSTPGRNLSSDPTETATTEPKDTKAPSRKTKPSSPVLIIPSTTAGSERCQTVSFWLLFFLALFI